MKKDRTILLLGDLLSAFESMNHCPIISVMKDHEGTEWELIVSWISEKDERKILDGIALKHGVYVIEEEGYTLFREMYP